MSKTGSDKAGAAGIVLMTLAAGQFLMTLDSSVMNVSIATVAKDVGTTVTGIQTAITLYTLVMASLMITGGKIGQIIGRKRAFAIGCVIYGCGSFDHRARPEPRRADPRLVGARGHRRRADHAGDRRARRVELRPRRAAARLRAGRVGRRDRGRGRAADRRAVHDLPARGGCVFVGRGGRGRRRSSSLARRMADAPPEAGARLDLVGTVLSALGLGLVVFGILRSGDVGLRAAEAGRARVARAVAGDLADPRRRRACCGCSSGGRTACSRRAASRSSTRRSCATRCSQGGLIVVLLPVPVAGRPVLRRPAVPVGGARAVGDRHRRAAPAAVDHAAPGRGRHPQGASRTRRRAAWSSSGSWPCSPASSC